MIHPGLWPQGMKALQEDVLVEAVPDRLPREVPPPQPRSGLLRPLVALRAVWAGFCARAALALRD
jgi:hypothetical protein